MRLLLTGLVLGSFLFSATLFADQAGKESKENARKDKIKKDTTNAEIMYTDSTDNLLIDFGAQKQGSQWQVINDGVMGGLSRGAGELSENSLRFAGKISLENNGGFSSLKAPFERTDLSAYEEVRIRYRHSGHPVAFTLEWHPRFWRAYHKVMLEPTGCEWKSVVIKLSDIKQYRMSRATGRTMQARDLKRVIRLGFIASEKEASEFNFEVDSIEFR